MSTDTRVTFSNSAQVHEILSIYDYTDHEISAAWFDEGEMDKITQRCFKILHKYENRSKNSSNKFCMRGLEGHSTQGAITKTNNRSAAYKAVLEEQGRLWNEPDNGMRMQIISDAYQRTSSSCQMWAQVIGRRDEQAVEAYLYDNDEAEQMASARSSTAVSSLKSKASSSVENEFRVLQKEATRASVSAQAA